jgi:hypothetical protein
MVNWTITLIVLLTFVPSLEASSYEVEIEKWRADREKKLKSDTGWLTVAGLFWLREGDNGVGSAEDNRIRLPSHSSPPRLGVLEHRAGKTIFRYSDKSQAPVTMKPDSEGSPTTIQSGSVSFWVIKRGPRFGVRMRDRQSAMRRNFSGLNWYPVSPGHRIEARFVSDPKTLSIPSIIGIPEDAESPGYVEFEINGETVRLRPTLSDDSLFFVFRDGTSGKTTYGASRFLYAGVPNDGRVILDFNKAYNPPCAFTPFATCPLPITENRLKVPIEAGEKKYGDH